MHKKKRCKNNPLIKPADIKPTTKDLEIKGVFNPAATKFNDETILLLRIAEAAKQKKDYIGVPIYNFKNNQSQMEIKKFDPKNPDVKLKDTRGVIYKGQDFLSTISTIRIAKSRDGINFKVEDTPFIFPTEDYEEYGCEDPRVVKINNIYYINYTAVSKDGYSTVLCTTKDFKTVENKKIIFCTPNKDVTLFPEKINNKYYTLHRPTNEGFGKSSIWIAESPDLIHWGNHKCIARPRKNNLWESKKIGGGAPLIKTDKGWLSVYHAKGDKDLYSLMILLFDLNNPYKIVYRSKTPFLYPEKDYEKIGFFPNVVFSDGLIEQKNNKLWIYYGGCDETINLFIIDKNELIG